MTVIIGATGVPLPAPQPLYPPVIAGIPGLVGTNRITLPPGGDILLPPGRQLVAPGAVTQVQVNDPVTQTWFPYNTSTTNEPLVVESDGVNYRVINPTGFPIGAVVTVSGTGYTSAPTVTPTPAGSLWVAIVGGALSSIVPTTGGSGVGYTVPPIINIAVPPAPGVPATATCTISGGSISTITIQNPGAGYTSPPAIVATPQASDVNFFSLTSTAAMKNATLTANLSFAGNVTAILMTNEGTVSSNVAPALSISGGGGSGAAATAILAQSIQSISVTTGGSGYGAAVGIMTVGGSLFTQTSGLGVAQLANPIVQQGLLIPRQAQIAATQGSGGGVGLQGASTYPANGSAIIDPGIFTAPPTAFAVPFNGTSGGGVTASFSLTMGGVSDTVYIQPL